MVITNHYLNIAKMIVFLIMLMWKEKEVTLALPGEHSNRSLHLCQLIVPMKTSAFRDRRERSFVFGENVAVDAFHGGGRSRM